MHKAITWDELKRMRELGMKGKLSEERTVETTDLSAEDEADLVHLVDVIEMQRLLARAADELERLYRGS